MILPEMRYPTCLLLLPLFLFPMTSAIANKASAPLVISHTEVVNLPTADNKIDYQLYVHVPAECQKPNAQCKTVYMLDAEYSFALSAQIVTHLSNRGRIPPVISVAIAYLDKSQYRNNRTRDYTPFFVGSGGYGKQAQRYSGGGAAFLKVIEQEIIPYVENNYPASVDDRTLVGHSYGGLFALYAWLWSPELFSNYIIVSPSLWYGEKQALRTVRETCESSSFDGSRNMYLAVGEYEEQASSGRLMVSDLRQLEGLLKSCEKRKVSTYLRVFEDETHASIFPAAYSTGLRKHFQ